MLPLHTGISFGPVYEGPPKLTTAPNPDFPNCIVRSSLRDRYAAVVPADWSLRSFSIKAIARDIAGRSHENVKLQDFCRFYRKQLQHVRVEVLAEIEKAAQAYPQYVCQENIPAAGR